MVLDGVMQECCKYHVPILRAAVSVLATLAHLVAVLCAAASVGGDGTWSAGPTGSIARLAACSAMIGGGAAD